MKGFIKLLIFLVVVGVAVAVVKHVLSNDECPEIEETDEAGE